MGTIQDAWGCGFFVQAEDGIGGLVRSRGLGEVYKKQFSARLDQAKVLLSQLAHEAEEVVRAIEADIEEVERRIEEFFSRAAHMVEDTVSSGWHAATSWL